MTSTQKAINAFEHLFNYAKAKAALSAVITFFVYSLGYDYIVIEVLAYLIIIDWILGIAAAINHQRFSSLHLSHTLYKIFFYLLLLIAVNQAVKISFIPGFTDDFIEAFITITELKSILENAALLGFKNAKTIEAKINAYLENKLNKE